MKCPTCGADNRPGANFCRMCGNELPEHVEAVVPTGKEAGESLGEMDAGAEADASSPDAPMSEVEVGPASPEDATPVTEMPGAMSEAAVEADPEPDREEIPPAAKETVDEPSDAGMEQGGSAPEAPETAAVLERPQPEVEEPVPAVVEGPVLSEVEGPVLSEVEGPVLSEVEGPVLSEVEGPVLSESEGTGVVPTEAAPTEAELNAGKAVASGVEEVSGDVEEDTSGSELAEFEPLVPVAPGTVIEGRFEVVAVLDAEEEEVLYLGHDLFGCWQCGFEGNDPDDSYCAQCGVLLDRRPQARLLEVRAGDSEPTSGDAVAARLSYEGRHFLLLEEPVLHEGLEGEAKPVVPEAPPVFRFVVGYASDAGQVRELDEDSLLALTLAPTYESKTGPVLGLYAVADGMGGHEGGEIASKLALQVLASEVVHSIILPELAGQDVAEELIVAGLREATVKANDAVFLERKKRANDMGTTLTTVLVRDDQLFLGHVGDCRAYRWNASGLQQLTTDHSLVASMIASGQAAPEEIYTHPHRSVIYRCIGDQPVVEVDTDILPLAPGDRIIVCCDGLWEMVRDEGIEDVMLREADPQAACELLVDHANAAGGDDNISVIVIQV